MPGGTGTAISIGPTASGRPRNGREALIARLSGYRLAEERKRHGLTQAQPAKAMGVSPGRVSQIERGEVATTGTIARYIEALGRRLHLVASFGDRTLTVATSERHNGPRPVHSAAHPGTWAATTVMDLRGDVGNGQESAM